MELLQNFKNSTIEIDLNISGILSTSFIEKLYFANREKDILLEDAGDVESINNMIIHKENILEIEEEYEDKLNIYLLQGTVTIIRL